MFVANKPEELCCINLNMTNSAHQNSFGMIILPCLTGACQYLLHKNMDQQLKLIETRFILNTSTTVASLFFPLQYHRCQRKWNELPCHLSADLSLENRSDGPGGGGALLALSVESELQFLLSVLFGSRKLSESLRNGTADTVPTNKHQL